MSRSLFVASIFGLSIDGDRFQAMPGFHYHFGVARQVVDAAFDDTGAPEPDVDDEYRFVVAGEWAIQLDEETTLTPLLEYAHFWNAGGVGTEDRDYLTASALVEYGRWNLALAYTGRFIDGTRGADSDDHQVQVSAGYAFDIGITADVGWKFVEEGGVQSEVLGALISYSLEF